MNRNFEKINEVTFSVPYKSDSDLKDYRIIRLPNKLTVLLISDLKQAEEEAENRTGPTDARENSREIIDKGSPQAMIALSINVGSFSDPPDIYGLSHFLEHMIFMGSEKYPGKNEFSNYLANNGGWTNASTDIEETVFYFKIDKNKLDGAIDRFSHLFIAPLLKKEAMTKERDIIQSEFSFRSHDDYLRMFQIVCNLGYPGRPPSAFTCGNSKTLKENITDDVLHRKINDYRRRHYSAHRINLCIQASKSLDYLDDLVRKYFSGVPCNNLPPDDFSHINEINAFQPEFLNRIYFAKAVSDTSTLYLTWCVQSFLKEFKTKPLSFITELMKSEEDGSLWSYLLKKSWATQFLTYTFDFSFASCLNVVITLTDEGFNNLQEVVSATYSYLKFLAQQTSNLEPVYKQLQMIRNNDFKYAIQLAADITVQSIVTDMSIYPSRYLLSGPKLYFDYDKDLIDNVINALNTNKCNIMTFSSKLYPNVVYDHRERWYGTEYTSWYLPDDWATLYDNAPILEDFYLPETNPFIPTDFTIFHPNDPSKYDDVPENILKNDICELWFKPDHKFRLPKIFISIYLISTMPQARIHFNILLDLYKLLLEKHFQKKLHSARTAGMYFSFGLKPNGLLISVHGFNQHIPSLLDIVTKEMITFVKSVTDVEFSSVLQELQQNLRNSIFQEITLTRHVLANVMYSNYWTCYEKFNILHGENAFTGVDFVELFADEFFKELKIKVLIQGNVTREMAQGMMRTVVTNLNCSKITTDKKLLIKQTIKVPLGNNYVCVKSFKEDNVNTTTLNYYQVGSLSIRNECLVLMLAEVIDRPFFNQLRTEEQLGYIVSVMEEENYDVIGYLVRVSSQENKFSAVHVESRIEQFLNKTLDLVRNISDEDFNNIRNSLINATRPTDPSLMHETSRYWTEIVTDKYVFDRQKRKANEFETITKQDLINFHRKYSFNNKRKMSFQVIGNVTNETTSATTMPSSEKMQFHLQFVNTNRQEGNTITDIQGFKRNLYMYPRQNNEMIAL